VRPEAFQDVVFTASGDRVVAEGSNAGTVLATGERYEHDWVMVFTIQDGKVQRFRHFYDTGDIAAAM
jgi:ketosteroid isomerase-like protein